MQQVSHLRPGIHSTTRHNFAEVGDAGLHAAQTIGLLVQPPLE